MWIDTIERIQITSSPDLKEEMYFFYSTILGLTKLPKSETLQPNGGTWDSLSDIQLHLSIEPDLKNSESRRHICFRVGHLSRFQQHLESHNINIIPNHQPISELERFYLRDPGGNRIEIAAPKVN